MKLLFCNVGWMDGYDGIDGDSIQRGGAYNKTSIGHEVCNFSNVDGIAYGYVQPTGQIKIEKLGATLRDDKVDGVTVVWLAGPKSGGTAVIGWYKNATVYRNPQIISDPSKRQIENGVSTFRVKALYHEAVLLPLDKRNVMIPRAVKGGIGQSNVWYADAPESAEHVSRVISFINGFSSSDVFPDVDDEVFGKEGNPRFRAHMIRERNTKIISEKKQQTLRETGALKCEVCSFDFHEFYGPIGDGFCEVHHLTPLSKSDGVIETKLSDLAVVCSNCHRMIHRTGDPMIELKELAKLIKS